MSDAIAFSTRTSAPSERRKEWSRFLSEVYFSLGVRTKDDDVHGEVATRTFGSIGLSSLAVSSSRAIRSRQSACVDKVERFCFVFPTQGAFEHRQYGHESKTGVGGVFVMNSADPYEVDNADDSANLCLTVPCDLLRARTRGLDNLCAKSGFADPMIASTVRHLVQATLAKGLQTDEGAFEDLCLDMLELMLSRSGESRLPVADIATSKGGALSA